MGRSRLAFLVALGLSLAPALALFPPQAGAEETGPLVVEVGSSLAYLDETALRSAIGSELRAQIIQGGGPQASSARGTLMLGLDRASKELLMTYRARSGSILVRKIKLPSERDAQITTIALLAGNLARDESAELLANLQPVQSASSAAASSTPPAASSSPAPEASSATPLLSASAPAEASSAPPAASAPPLPPCSRRYTPQEPVAFHLIPGVGYPFADEPYHTPFSLSLLLGSVGEIRDGAQIGAVISHTQGDVSGVTLGGFGTATEGRIQGAALGGTFQIGKCDAQAILGAGTISLQQGSVEGAQLAGLISITGGSFVGLQGASLFSAVRGDLEGFQGSGLFNATRGKVTGFQGAGLFNVARGGLKGFQGAGLFNVAGDVEGVQASSVLNIGGRVKGVQIGLINLASHMDGLPIGLFSFAGNTRLQPLLWLSARPRYNLGLKMTTGYAYQIVSTSFQQSNEAPEYGFSYALGLHFPLDNLFLDVDLAYHHLFPNLHLDKSKSSPEWKDKHTELLKLRVIGGVDIWRHFGVFFGGGSFVDLEDLSNNKRPKVQQDWIFGIQL